MASSANHLGVNLKGIYFEDFLLTVSLTAGITVADIGKAVTKDGTVANTYKLSGDGDPIDGRLESVEDRTIEGTLIGTVSFRFAEGLPIKSGQTVLVGDTVLGAGSGEVKSMVLTALATVDGSDAATTQALANAIKAKLNTLLSYRDWRSNMVVAVSGSTATVIKV